MATTTETVKRPSKLTAKGALTRKRIVIAAAELMFANGVAGTTVEHVRDAAGVSSSQVYHYFEDKQALVRAVIEHQSDTVVGGQEPLFAQLDSLEGLQVWRDFLVEHQRQLGCRGGCPIGSLGSELAELDDQARRDVASSFTRWEAGIRGGLRAMYERGELDADARPDDLAIATLSALQGGLLLTQIQRTTRPLETALDAMLGLIRLRTLHRAPRERRFPGSAASLSSRSGLPATDH